MTEPIDLLAAVKASAEQVRAIRAAEPAPPPREPERGSVGDLSVGSVVLTVAHSFRTCRACLKGIHVGQPLVAHYPVETSNIADHYHPTCLEGTDD